MMWKSKCVWILLTRNRFVVKATGNVLTNWYSGQTATKANLHPGFPLLGHCELSECRLLVPGSQVNILNIPKTRWIFSSGFFFIPRITRRALSTLRWWVKQDAKAHLAAAASREAFWLSRSFFSFSSMSLRASMHIFVNSASFARVISRVLWWICIDQSWTPWKQLFAHSPLTRAPPRDFWSLSCSRPPLLSTSTRSPPSSFARAQLQYFSPVHKELYSHWQRRYKRESMIANLTVMIMTAKL